MATVSLTYTGAEVQAALALANKVLTADTTVNLTAAMTAAQIQTLINAQPKNLGGYTLLFQFADGTYTMSNALEFKGFYNGALNTYGNQTEAATKHTNQAVYLNFNNSTNGLFFRDCQKVNVDRLKIQAVTSATLYCPIKANDIDKMIVFYCYLLGNSVANGAGINLSYAKAADVNECYMSTMTYALYASNSPFVLSRSNSITGTATTVGLCADQAATIVKIGIQPAGTTPEVVANSGIIR